MNEFSISNTASAGAAELLDKVLEVIDALVIVCSPDGTIHRFNKKCEDVTGFSAAEMLGRPIWDLIPEDEHAGVERVMERFYAGDFPNRYLNHWKAKVGRPALIAWSNNAIVDDRGRVEHIIGTGIDISDRSRMEASFRAAIDSFEDGFALYDCDDRLVAVNGAFWNFFGDIRPHIKVGMTFREVGEAVYRNTDLQEKFGTFDEYWAVRGDLRGRAGQFYVREYAPGRFLRTRNFATSDSGMAAFITDITDEIRHDRTFKSLIKVTSDPLLTLSQRLDKMLKIGREHFGMELGILTRVAGDVSTIEHASTDDAVFQVGGAVPLEESYSQYFFGADGVVHFEDVEALDLKEQKPFRRKPLYSLIGAQVDVSGMPYGALYFSSNRVATAPFTDDDRQIVELLANWAGMNIRLANVIAELDRFAYIASHDLKAPLRAIDNLSQWIEEDAGDTLDGDARDHLTLLRGRTARLEKLLNDLLEFSRAGRSAGSPEKVDTGDLVGDVIEMIAPPENLTVVCETPMPEVYADPVSLTQVFANLLSNAIKHHDKDTGRIEISVAEAGNCWEFSVEDDGPGIPNAFRERIFDIFQTLKPRDEVEGSGMGLAIVKKLVDAAGGRIIVSDRNQNRQGSAFRFTWPKSENKVA